MDLSSTIILIKSKQKQSEMSSVGLSGMSGISENTLQNRYEKALKQINKLI